MWNRYLFCFCILHPPIFYLLLPLSLLQLANTTHLIRLNAARVALYSFAMPGHAKNVPKGFRTLSAVKSSLTVVAMLPDYVASPGDPIVLQGVSRVTLSQLNRKRERLDEERQPQLNINSCQPPKHIWEQRVPALAFFLTTSVISFCQPPNPRKKRCHS